MPYSYKNATSAIRAGRVKAELAARAAYERALENDGFYRADMDYRAASLDYAVGKITADDLKAVRCARAQTLESMHLREADLEPKYACPLCNDSGVSNGRPCKCVVDLFIRSSRDNVMIPLGKFAEVKPAPFQERVFGVMRGYAARFPDTNRRVVLLMGGAGVGKTMLAGCVADAILSGGHSVMALTAFGFTDRMMRYHTTFDESRSEYLSPALDCDLLVIDDLGTESMLKNVTREYLYLVVNERNLAGKHTLITTNLSADELTARYGERTASRLFDKSICYAAELVGEDLRKIRM